MQRSFHSLGPIALCLTSVVLAVACGDDGDSVSCTTNCGGDGGTSSGSGGKANGGSVSEGGVVSKAGMGGMGGKASGGTAGTATGGTAGTATGGTAGTATGGTAGTATGGTAGTATGGTAGTAGGMVVGGSPGEAGMAGQPMSDAGAAGLAGAAGAPTGPVGPTITGDIILQYNFSENAGTAAVDATVNHLDGIMTDTAWLPGRNGAGLSLATGTSLVTLPPGIVSSATEFTAATWVYLTGDNSWARIFDFGDSTDSYMFLTAHSGDGFTRFAMKLPGVDGEQRVEIPALIPLNVWKHIAVTLSATGARLYVDGHQVAANAAFTAKPADLGVTQQNWIGKSEFPDPALQGQLDEFYLYKKALTETEIQALAAPKTDYSLYHFDETTGTTAVDSSDNHKDATLVGATFTAGHLGNALTTGVNAYATLPAGIIGACNDLTVATWFKETDYDTWNRIYDFGFSQSTGYLFLTPRAGRTENLGFGISLTNYADEPRAEVAQQFDLNTWYHVASVIEGTTARVYVNGAQVATGTFHFTLAQLQTSGPTPNNYLGKSQYPDPNLRGQIDEMLISCRAYTADEIKMLAQ